MGLGTHGPFVILEEKLIKYLKINSVLGASFARHSGHLSAWGIHGTFKFITNPDAVACSHETSTNIGLVGNLLLRGL